MCRANQIGSSTKFNEIQRNSTIVFFISGARKCESNGRPTQSNNHIFLWQGQSNRPPNEIQRNPTIAFPWAGPVKSAVQRHPTKSNKHVFICGIRKNESNGRPMKSNSRLFVRANQTDRPTKSSNIEQSHRGRDASTLACMDDASYSALRNGMGSSFMQWGSAREGVSNNVFIQKMRILKIPSFLFSRTGSWISTGNEILVVFGVPTSQVLYEC